MNLETLLIHLQAWTQAETAAQQNLRDVLARLQRAVIDGDGAGLLDASDVLDQSLEQNIGRDTRRADLMRSLAAHFDVPAKTLSLTSTLDRAAAAGVNVESMRKMRDELRAVVQEVNKGSRLLAVLASHHRSVLGDLMTILGANSSNEAARSAGVLVDAEA